MSDQTRDQQEPNQSSDAEAAVIEKDLERVVEDLEAARRQEEQTSRRLDEVMRAYSGLLNEQKEFRLRLERERARVLETERGKIGVQLIEVGDELDRALAAAQDDSPLAQGVRMIREGVLKRLAGLGIERMALAGAAFDPLVAEAIDIVPVPERERDGMVVDEVLPSYKLGERVLRPARVRVGRYVEAPAAPSATPEPDGPG